MCCLHLLSSTCSLFSHPPSPCLFLSLPLPFLPFLLPLPLLIPPSSSPSPCLSSHSSSPCLSYPSLPFPLPLPFLSLPPLPPPLAFLILSLSSSFPPCSAVPSSLLPIPFHMSLLLPLLPIPFSLPPSSSFCFHNQLLLVFWNVRTVAISFLWCLLRTKLPLPTRQLNRSLCELHPQGRYVTIT